MGAVLALDIGGKRTGVAISDENQTFAFPHSTIETHRLKEEITKIKQERNISTIVVGMPKNLKNEDTDNTRRVLDFIKKIQKWFPELLIFSVDERFTSKIAKQAHLMGGMKKMDRRVKEYTDTTSATLILQSFLEQKDRLLPENRKP